MSDQYEVGYRKPPQGTRFQKGRSGNPKGRPKSDLSIDVILQNTLMEKIRIQENGSWKTVTKFEAFFKSLVNRALSGEKQSTREIIKLLPAIETSIKANAPTKLIVEYVSGPSGSLAQDSTSFSQDE